MSGSEDEWPCPKDPAGQVAPLFPHDNICLLGLGVLSLKHVQDRTFLHTVAPGQTGTARAGATSVRGELKQTDGRVDRRNSLLNGLGRWKKGSSVIHHTADGREEHCGQLSITSRRDRSGRAGIHHLHTALYTGLRGKPDTKVPSFVTVAVIMSVISRHKTIVYNAGQWQPVLLSSGLGVTPTTVDCHARAVRNSPMILGLFSDLPRTHLHTMRLPGDAEPRARHLNIRPADGSLLPPFKNLLSARGGRGTALRCRCYRSTVVTQGDTPSEAEDLACILALTTVWQPVYPYKLPRNIYGNSLVAGITGKFCHKLVHRKLITTESTSNLSLSQLLSKQTSQLDSPRIARSRKRAAPAGNFVRPNDKQTQLEMGSHVAFQTSRHGNARITSLTALVPASPAVPARARRKIPA
ncbi:hypothetical protein Bbelb_059710 [Branchiostoma belcheri]|nr:hypothetical protein Bbelb_059710 [Branchiostoma belcheri]